MFQPNSKFGRRVEYVCTVNYHFERHCCLFLHLWSCSSYFGFIHSLHAGYFDCGCIHWFCEGSRPPQWGGKSHNLTGSSRQINGLHKKVFFLTSCTPVISWPHNPTLFDHNRKRVEISQINEIEKLVQGGWVPGAGPVQPVVDPELHPASIAASTA